MRVTRRFRSALNRRRRSRKSDRGERGHLGLLKADEKHAKRKTLAAEVPAVKHLRELRAKPEEGYTEGQKLTVELFGLGERVDVVGISKGRGFAGNVKRHGFSGGPRTHGQSDRLRTSGSIGPQAPRRARFTRTSTWPVTWVLSV